MKTHTTIQNSGSGWMGGWMGGRASLSIAYSKKILNCYTFSGEAKLIEDCESLVEYQDSIPKSIYSTVGSSIYVSQNIKAYL